MEYHHSPECPHCWNGCTHAHDENDPFEVSLELIGAHCGLQVVGSRMRRGGEYHDPATGIVIGTDEWRSTRCQGCGLEAMTPIEMIPPMAAQERDGRYMVACGRCLERMSRGQHPEHRRRRRSHR